MSAVLPTPTERLALSRERLRRAMRNTSGAPGTPGNQHGDASAPAWLETLKSIPLAGIVIEALNSWWAQHPLRMAALVAVGASKAVLRPTARRHPLGLVLGALLLGGLFAWSRPWRWLLKPAIFAGLLPQLLSKAMAHVSIDSWLAVLASLSQPTHKPSPMPEEPALRAQPGAREQRFDAR